MDSKNYSKAAIDWIDLLIPEGFNRAADLISDKCNYKYMGQILVGKEVINPFIENHEKALQQLDAIEYQRAIVKEITSDGVAAAVSDKIYLNGKTHIYHDELFVRMEKINSSWLVVYIEHRPIPEERVKLRNFLDSNGPKKQVAP